MDVRTPRLQRPPVPDSGILIDRRTRTRKAYAVRKLEVGDTGAFLRFHRRILGTLGHPSCLDQRDKRYVSDKMSRSGLILGAFVDGGLVGYACLRFIGGPGETYAEAVGIGGHEIDGVAEMDGAAVDPAYRRTGLYRDLLRFRERAAASESKRHLVGIVSVHNPRSMIGVLAAGYRIRAVYHDHFGANLVIHKDLRLPCHPDDADAGLSIPIEDVPGHRRALATSRWGCALVGSGADTAIAYLRCLPAY